MATKPIFEHEIDIKQREEELQRLEFEFNEQNNRLKLFRKDLMFSKRQLKYAKVHRLDYYDDKELLIY